MLWTKKGVKKLSNSLLVREIQRTVKGYPDAFQVHRPNLDNMSGLLALENAVATSPRHAGDIQQLRTVDHVVVFSTRNTNALGLNLEAQAALVFPKSCGHSRLHAWRRDLPCSIRGVLLELLPCSWCRWPRRTHRWQGKSLLHHSRTHRRRHRVARSHWWHRARVLLIRTIAVLRV